MRACGEADAGGNGWNHIGRHQHCRWCETLTGLRCDGRVLKISMRDEHTL